MELEVELVGARSTTRAATMALSPRDQFLAAGTAAARPHAAAASGWGAGGDSRIDILRLWKKDGEPERGRQLEVLATIPAPSNRAFHRLAWSASHAENSAYPLGLLAGAMDDGVICVWDPSVLQYQPDLKGDNDGNPRFSLSAFSSGFFGEPSKRSHQSQSTSTAGDQCQKKTNEAAAQRSLEFKKLVKDGFTLLSLGGLPLETDSDDLDFEDWILPEKTKKIESGIEDWVLPENPNRIDSNGLIVKLNDNCEQVFALSFNNQHAEVLACAASCGKIKLYHLEYPMKTYELDDAGSNSRSTFLDWHPHYPVALASSGNTATAMVWDLRVKKPTHKFNQKNKHCTEIRWNQNDPFELVVGSIGEEDTVQIWDLRYSYRPLIGFGPAKGVVSLSWSPDPNVIITTDIDGGIDCWKLNVTKGPDSSLSVYEAPDHRSLPLGEKLETVWFTDNEIASSSSRNIGLYKMKLPW